MIKLPGLTIILISLFNSSFAQTKQELDSLLLPLYNIENSKNLSKASQAKQIIGYGSKVLPLLSAYFTDTTQTKIKSECQSINLNKGEVAIILCDRIETMPYAMLTGVQNCLVEFCKDNPNLIEYYLDFIRREGIKLFKEKYINWLASTDRKKWTPYVNSKKKKR